MTTYEDIKKANDTIRPMIIEKTNTKTGKTTKNEYAEVNQRIKAFRMVYPDGFILSDLLSNVNGVCIFLAQVGYYAEDGTKRILATGTAYEKEGSTFINKTSYIENCETSAVGRALGMAGFGIDTSVASAEEVQNAMINQAASDKITEVQAKALIKRCTGDKVDINKILELYKVKDFADLTARQYSHINLNWEKIKGGKA